MDHVTLIAGMAELHMLILKMFRHADDLNLFPGPGCNDFVMAAQAQII
jgi:hypothetical protein